MKAKRLAQLALLTAAALILFVVELQLPELIPIAGVKLGLANVVTLFAVYRFSAKEAAMVVTARVFLGCLFAGNPTALIYSYAGALLCMCAMLLLKKDIPEKFLWLNSMVGAVFHNIGQLLAASLMLGTFSVFAYLPILLISGCTAGFFTGICARLVLSRFKRGGKNK